jgi:phosphoribosylformylglycinamidine synthase
VGDPSLSAREIIGNESQERMGLILKAQDVPLLQKIAEREGAPLYIIGDVTNNHRFTIENRLTGEKPVDLELSDLLGKTPVTEMIDHTVVSSYTPVSYKIDEFEHYLESVLQLDSVACKDWLTSKADRSVSGLVANQPTVGEIQLPLNNFGAMALSYRGNDGVAVSVGHAPAAALINAAAGSRLAIAKALSNIVWAPIEGGLSSVSLSANWMWPCRNAGEDARLYQAVEAASNFCIDLGINIPTGKDSLSMTQKYPDGTKVLSPGTVIITAMAPMKDVRKPVRPLLVPDPNSQLIYIDLSQSPLSLGGSAFAQASGQLGASCPDIPNAGYFALSFNTIQSLINEGYLLSGHDVSAGGLVTTLLELCFANKEGGLSVDLSQIPEKDPIKALFSENPAVVIQVAKKDIATVLKRLKQSGITFYPIGRPQSDRKIDLHVHNHHYLLDIDHLRDLWFHTSFLLEQHQTVAPFATERYHNYKQQPLAFSFPNSFNGKLQTLNGSVQAAVIREKGTNGDREMAWALYQVGFEVKDVHTSDLISGRETLDDIRLVVFSGGFSHADALGAAKGWAAFFLYNPKAKAALERFYARPDTLSIGIGNGCQLMAELNLITGGEEYLSPKLKPNASGRFECGFVNVTIPESNAIMLQSLIGSRLGVWVASGQARFDFPKPIENYHIALKYSYQDYPGNPNGSPLGIAAICSADGRHLAMMPHPERCLYPWNWAHYPAERRNDEVSPWVEMFAEAKKWFVVL